MWEGYLASGLLTLLTADPKAGKTTLLTHLFKGMESSKSFLERSLKDIKTLMITEESKVAWYKKKNRFGLRGDNLFILSRYFYDRTSISSWEEAVQGVTSYCLANEIRLVVFDTISYFWPVEDENQATSVINSLRPLHELTNEGLAVLIVHHDNKSGGSNINSTRGSSAIAGIVDIKLGLKRSQGKQRVLIGDGRYEETPDKLTIELDTSEEDSRYLVANSSGGYTKSRISKLKKILHLFPEAPEGISVSQLLDNWDQDKLGNKPTRSTLNRWLSKGSEEQLVIEVGTAEKRGQAKLWSRNTNN